MDKELIKLSEKLKVLGHPVRLQIVYGLINNKDNNCNVNMMAEKLGLPQPTVSQHLSALRKVEVIEAVKDGVSTCHRVVDQKIIELLK